MWAWVWRKVKGKWPKMKTIFCWDPWEDKEEREGKKEKKRKTYRKEKKTEKIIGRRGKELSTDEIVFTKTACGHALGESECQLSSTVIKVTYLFSKGKWGKIKKWEDKEERKGKRK
jgi:hypothetical protein